MRCTSRRENRYTAYTENTPEYVIRDTKERAELILKPTLGMHFSGLFVCRCIYFRLGAVDRPRRPE